MSITPGVQLSYHELRKLSPEAAREAVCSVQISVRGDTSETTRILHTSRPTVYLALRKKQDRCLGDTSHKQNIYGVYRSTFSSLPIFRIVNKNCIHSSHYIKLFRVIGSQTELMC